MQVKDVMIPAVAHLEPDMSLRDAAERMKALDLDPMPVVDGGTVVGVLTERDVVARAETDGLAVGSHRVREAMSSDPDCCRAEEEISDALARVRDRGTARMPVIDANRHLVGIVAMADLIKHEQPPSTEGMAVGDVESITDLVAFDDDRVDFMSDESFPASDPIPPPTTLGPDRKSDRGE